MTQPGFDFAPETRPHKRVSETSVAGRDVVKATCEGRKVAVLRWLSGYWNRWNESPTAAEILRWAEAHEHQELGQRDRTGRILYVRRGLSDLKAKGVVEVAGVRFCTAVASKAPVDTWRVRERGTGPA